jgi:hypothetical protein
MFACLLDRQRGDAAIEGGLADMWRDPWEECDAWGEHLLGPDASENRLDSSKGQAKEERRRTLEDEIGSGASSSREGKNGVKMISPLSEESEEYRFARDLMIGSGASSRERKNGVQVISPLSEESEECRFARDLMTGSGVSSSREGNNGVKVTSPLSEESEECRFARDLINSSRTTHAFPQSTGKATTEESDDVFSVALFRFTSGGKDRCLFLVRGVMGSVMIGITNCCFIFGAAVGDLCS